MPKFARNHWCHPAKRKHREPGRRRALAQGLLRLSRMQLDGAHRNRRGLERRSRDLFFCLFEVNWLIHRHSLDLPTAPSGAVPARRDGALGRAGARGAAHARARPRGRGPEHLQRSHRHRVPQPGARGRLLPRSHGPEEIVHPRVADTDASGAIRWRKPLSYVGGEHEKEAKARDLHKLLSLDKYLQTYDSLAGDIKLSSFTDFRDWRAEVPGHGSVLCCPEDHRCRTCPDHAAQGVLCEHCEVPICRDCQEHLATQKLPPLSLCNDMWTGFAPERLHREKVTVMEMICASPCLTMLLCMSMEAKKAESCIRISMAARSRK